MASAITRANIKQTVATAGTISQLITSSTLAVSAVIQALAGNTGTIYVGGSDVTDHSGTAPGIALTARESYTLANIQWSGTQLNFDLSDFYLDTSVNGEGVTVEYFTNARVPNS